MGRGKGSQVQGILSVEHPKELNPRFTGDEGGPGLNETGDLC